MNHLYTTPMGFVHAVRYRDAMLHAWMKRTGRANSQGSAYHPRDLPAYMDVPTNEERSHAEVIEFTLYPLPPGEKYTAYLKMPKVGEPCALITTFTGDALARVKSITYNKPSRRNILSDTCGTFTAKGIDGRTYKGRHNGDGMYCTMRVVS